jgi:hypothetical protein
MRSIVRVFALLAGGMTGTAGCDGCGDPVSGDETDAGADAGADAGSDAGLDEDDAGRRADAGADAGDVAVDAGVIDGGSPFDLEDLFGEAGIPEELACLPGAAPELSIAGLLATLDLSPYAGLPEDGVRCGPVTCDDGVPCCVLCGFAACAVSVDGGPLACPAFTQVAHCDGAEECGGADDTCCFSLSGTDCRPEQECNFDVGALLDGGFVIPGLDGGLALPDAGDVDGGAVDAGDAGPAPDAGGLGDVLEDILAQGVPVCRSSLFDSCEALSGELCCTSERIVALDLGVCVPALLCTGDLFPLP